MAIRLTGSSFLSVARKSGLVGAGVLDSHVKRLAERGVNTDKAGPLADALVADGIITAWQSERLLRGESTGYFLGQYQLTDLLGEGGMSRVYRAQNPAGKHFAIKVLIRSDQENVMSAPEDGSSSLAARFVREAKMATSLDHPNIVRAFEFDSTTEGDEELHYLVMEFVDGRTLDRILKDGPLEPGVAATAIRDAAAGTACAHKAGIIHRDIKPGNLITDSAGCTRLLDLGLARYSRDEDIVALTMAAGAQLLGTFDYISPEQARDGHEVDDRTDIYSLGSTLFHLLTGVTAFKQGTMAQRMLWLQTKEPPPVRQLRADIPEELEAIVAKMLRLNPDDRFQTAEDVIAALSKWGRDPPRIHAATQSPPQKSSPQNSSQQDRDSASRAREAESPSMSDQNAPAIGIDLGTTYSVVSRVDSHGRPESLRNAEGDLTTPSVVFFDKTSAIVGKEAVFAAEHEPQRVARFAKRDMGEEFCQKPIRGEQLPPEVVQAIILRKLKADATRTVGEFSRAVITVPAYFNEPRRKATQDAARLAGIELLDVINEPTAAAIMYGIQQGFLNAQGESLKKETVLVFDLGGGTFDCTLMEIDGQNYNCVGTLGEVQLGGIDWDRRVVDHLAEQWQQEHGSDPRQDDCSYEVLLHAAVEAKHNLSTRPETTVPLAIDGNRSRIVFTRETFEAITKDLLDRTLESVKKLLAMTKRDWKDLTQLVLVGGSTRMPMVSAMLAQESGLSLDSSLSPDEAVSHGAALYAAMLLGSKEVERRRISVENVNSHDLGVMVIDAVSGKRGRQILIPRNTRLPTSHTERNQTAKFDQRSVRIDVVEGGDSHGEGAAKIGKVVVRDLPPELPVGTAVEVTFNYERNGCLKVSASIPTLNRTSTLEIDRASGLSEDKVEYWSGRILDGMQDSSVPATTIQRAPGIVEVVNNPAAPAPVSQPAAPAPVPAPATSAQPVAKPKPKPLGTPAAPAPAAPGLVPKPLGKPALKQPGLPKPLGQPAVAGQAAPKPLGQPAAVAGQAAPKQLGQPAFAGQPKPLGQPKQLGQPKPLGQPKQLGQPAAAGTQPKPLAQPKPPGQPKPLGQPKQLGQPAAPAQPAGQPPASGTPAGEPKKKASWKSRAKKVSAGDD